MESALEPQSGADKRRTPKPASVWAAQGLLALAVVVAVVRTIVGPGSSFLQAAICLVLIVLVQARVAWARWAVSASLVLLAGVALVRQVPQWTSGDAAFGLAPLQIEVRPEERVGAVIGGMMFCALFIVLAGRVAFGAPERAYFRSETAGTNASGHHDGSKDGPAG